MMDISFEINGRKVNPNNMKGELEKAIFKDIAKKVKRNLQSVRCKEHEKAPGVKVKGHSINNLNLEISGCCQSLINKATAKLK